MDDLGMYFRIEGPGQGDAGGFERMPGGQGERSGLWGLKLESMCIPLLALPAFMG